MLNGKATKGIELYGYQKQGIVQIENFNGNVLLADQMGLGKTVQVLMALKYNPDWLPALLVVPATVKLNWQYEASRFAGLSSSVCESRTPPRHGKFNFSTHTPLTIINYDILKDWLPYLKQQGFKTLVCDEIQACQSPKTHRTKAVQQVAVWVEHVMMLSGTPLSNRPIELFPILNMLWPKAFPSFATYAQSYCRPRYTPWGWKYDGAENLDQLHAILRELGMIRRRKADVLQDLPPKVRRIIPCELSNPQEYYDANENFILWLKKNAAHRVQSAMRAQSLVKLGMLLQISARLKIKTPIDWANRFLEETDEKLVMFACHEKAIDALKRRIEAKSVVLDGTIGNRERQLAVDQFQHDDSVRVFIGSRAAWSGITLTAASNIGMVELFWRPGDVLQAESRIDRIGQKAVSTIWYFIAQGTIEERLCTILQEKQEVISAVLDGGKNPGDLNIFSLLLDEIQQTL